MFNKYFLIFCKLISPFFLSLPFFLVGAFCVGAFCVGVFLNAAK